MSLNRTSFLTALLLTVGLFSAAAHAENSNFIDVKDSVSPSVAPGQSVTVNAQVTSTKAVSGITINISFFDNKGNYLGVKSFTKQSFDAGQTITENVSWPIAAKAVNGTYSTHVDVWQYSSSGSRTYENGNILSFKVAPSTALACGSTPSGSTITKTISTVTGSAAATKAQCPNGGTQATTTTVTQVELCTNGVLSNQGAQVSTTVNTGSPSCNPGTALSCGSTPSGQTVTQTISTTAGSIAATTAQCPAGGTQPTKITVTQVELCTNGVLSNQGAQVSTTVDNGNPTCNALLACGSTPSGSTVTKTVSTSTGSTAATTAQCPNGGTQPTTITVTQLELCTNGVLSNQGAQVSTTVNSGNPTCNGLLSCGSTPSGSTVSKTVSTTTGSIAATTAQCPAGGTQATTTTVTQVQLCTNGVLSNQGAQVSNTVDTGNPTCNALLACGSTASGSTVTKTVSTTTGSTAATTAQCASGGTQPTTTTVTQLELCTNGVLSNQGAQVSTTVNTGSPTCNPTLANGQCGSASGVATNTAPAAGVLCNSGTASALSGTGPWKWTCTGNNTTNANNVAQCSDTLISSSGGNCNYASNGYTDGCASAQGGIVQAPSMLNGYAKRPPWDVAGVDYYIGVPSDITLKDPTLAGALPTGATYSASSHTVTISGSNVVLNGFDFSLHNMTALVINGANDTVENSYFEPGSNFISGGVNNTAMISVNSSASNVSLLNNEVNGNNIPVTLQQIQAINVLSSGTVTIEYNYLHNAGGDMIDFSGGPQVEYVRYNFFKDNGLETDHSDTIQWCSEQVTSGDLGFNTVEQTLPGLSGMGLLELNSECAPASMSHMVEHNNTLISLKADNMENWGVGADIENDVGIATSDHIAVIDNYIDPTGITEFTNSPWFAINGEGVTFLLLPQPVSMYGLTNMVTGALIPVPSVSNPTDQGYSVYPDPKGNSPSFNDVFSITASPASGTVNAGSTVTFTVNMDEAWEVTGIPTLSLNDGGTASYVDGSGTNALIFSHTVSSTSTSTSALQVTAFNLNGATMKDGAGNSVNIASTTATLSGLAISASAGSGSTGSGGAGGSTTTNAACGVTPSGSTVTLVVSTTSGSIAATAAQCANGGTQPTTTTVTQVQLCTNGVLSNQGSQVSTTVDTGNPTCNPASGGTGGNCPFSSNATAAGLADGCSGAPAGTALYPNMLSTYGSKRPSWDVAGVDYYVGGPQNTASLKDPTTSALPTGCSASSKSVSCSGSNITVSGYDFSLHGGMQLSISGTGNTVTGNNFALAPNCSDPILSFTISANGTLAVTKNTFNGGGATCGTLVFGTMLNGNYGAGSTLTLDYNYFYATPQDLLDSGGPKSGTATIIEEYNLYYVEGFQGHPDGIQLNGGNFNGIVVAYNTFYNPYGANTDAGTQPFHIEAQLTSAITNSTVAYNTMVTPSTSCNGGGNWPNGCSVNFDIACKSDGAGDSNTGFAAYGNYIDASGAIAALTNGYACTNTTWGSPAANIDMTTGAALSTNPN